MNWHQRQAAKRDKIQLWSKTLYTVVIDKPNLISVIRCEHSHVANTLAESTGGYVLLPGGQLDRRTTKGELT